MAKTAKLTEKQQRFVDEYLIDLNATQAAIRAGYSAKTADQQGSRMLANVKVQQAISVAMAERSKRTGINQDRVVLELARIAFVKMTDLVDGHGRIKDGASEDDLACIESVKYKQSESETGSSVEREVKISPKLKALELLEVKTTVTFEEGHNWSNTKAAIAEAVDAYFLELRKNWSETSQTIVRVSQIENRILGVDGVVDVTGTKLNGTASNMTLTEFCIPKLGGVSA